MSLLLFIVFGFIVGLLARAVMPGRQKMGMIVTTLLGIAGSFVGGLIASLISGDNVADSRLSTAGLIGSVIGAVILLALYGFIGRRSHFTRRSLV
jgi:uncharacterized membrane protein YeaQ/YmgE (transglycosylase-associated protein family)